MTQYHRLLLEIELWLQTTRDTITTEALSVNVPEIQNELASCSKLNEELLEKENKLKELTTVCEEFKNYPDLKELSETLLEHLRILIIIFTEQKLIVKQRIEILQTHLITVQERIIKQQASPDSSSQDNTLDSSSMPVEEIPVHADTKKLTIDFITSEKQPTGVNIETQTGESLISSLTVIPSTTQDISAVCNPPVDVEIQTQKPEQSSSELQAKKEAITISKTVIGNSETIQIATKPIADDTNAAHAFGDLLVEADYRTKPEMEQKDGHKTTELNILHSSTDKPFETVMVEPDETTTEVIVDSDGTKRIIVKKLHRTVVSRQQRVQQQQLTTMSTLVEDDAPVTQSFSQVTLQGQQSSTTIARGDGHKETVTSQNYGGKVMSGVAGGEIHVQEFQSDPEHHYTVVESSKPTEVELQGIKLHEGDVTLVDDKNTLIPIDEKMVQHGEEIHTSSSTVRAVVQQVTRKIIRRTRRIIRRIVIIDGKEQVTEEVVEEPEEVEITEEGIPRVSINVTRTQDGTVVQDHQFGESSSFVQTEPMTTVTKTVTSIVLGPDGKPIDTLPENVTILQHPDERYVVEQETALETSSAPIVTESVELVSEKSPDIKTTSVSSIISEFIENEKSAPSSIEITHKVIEAPSSDLAPAVISPKKIKKKDKFIEKAIVTVATEKIETPPLNVEEEQILFTVPKVNTTKQEIVLSPVISQQDTLTKTEEEIKWPTILCTDKEQTCESRNYNITVGDALVDSPISNVIKTVEDSKVAPSKSISPIIQKPKEDSIVIFATSSSPTVITTQTLEFVSLPAEIETTIMSVPSKTTVSETVKVSPVSTETDSVEQFVVQSHEIITPEVQKITEVSALEPQISTIVSELTSEEPIKESLVSTPINEKPNVKSITSQFIHTEQLTDLQPELLKDVVPGSPKETVSSQKSTPSKSKKKHKSKDPVQKSPVEIKSLTERDSTSTLENIEVERDQFNKNSKLTHGVQIVTSIISKESKPIVEEISTQYSTPDSDSTSFNVEGVVTISHQPEVVDNATQYTPKSSPECKEINILSIAEERPVISSLISESNIKPNTPDVNTQFIVSEQSHIQLHTPMQADIKLPLSEKIKPQLTPELTSTLPKSNTACKVPSGESQGVEFVLSLEEKQVQFERSTPKVSISMKIEEDKNKLPAEVLQKDIHVSLPTITKQTKEVPIVSVGVSPIIPKIEDIRGEVSLTTEIDHGGRKGKKKKKHKDSDKSTPEEETRPSTVTIPQDDEKPYSIETSLAESTEIIIPESSGASPDTPKPSNIEFELEEDEEISENVGKDTGYEPEDKTTVDESLADEDDHDKKKKRKKKRKQKVKTIDSEESNVPKSVYDSTPVEESIQFSDEEITEVKSKFDEPKKDKKRKRGKTDVKKTKFEPETESETNIVEAYSEELLSANDSYKTLPSLSETGSVKIMEEKRLSIPQSDSLESITTKIVTTIPVVEAVITQESTVQTSPEVSEITEDLKATTKPTEQISIQTSPEIPVETIAVSLQTSEEEPILLEGTLKPQPETTDSASQIEFTTVEMVTQTSTPEKLSTPIDNKIITIESEMQTITPDKIEVVEQTVQTVTPELVRSDSSMQTAVVTSQERFVQTITPDLPEVQMKETIEIATQIHPTDMCEHIEHSVQTSPVTPHSPLNENTQTSTPEPQIQETAEFSVQLYPSDVFKYSEQYVQTSPPPSAPPLEDVMDVSKQSSETKFDYPKTSTNEVHITTVETTSQTKPVIVQDVGEFTPTPPTSLDEPYEVHVQALITLPSDDTDTTDKSENTSDYPKKIQDSPLSNTSKKTSKTQPSVISAPVSKPIQKTDNTDTILVSESTSELPSESVSESSGSDLDEFDVQVTVDGKPVDKNAVVTTFLDAERTRDSDLTSKRRRQRKRKQHKDPKDSEVLGIEKGLFDQFKRNESKDQLDPNELYSEVVRKGSRSSSPIPGDDYTESIVVSKVITDINNERIKKIDEPSQKASTTDQTPSTLVKVSVTIPTDKSKKDHESYDNLRIDDREPLPLKEKVKKPESLIKDVKEVIQPTTNIELQPSEVLITELSIDTSTVTSPADTPKHRKPIKHKGKNSKYKTSVTIEEVMSPTEVADTPLTPSTDAPLSPPDLTSVSAVWSKPLAVSKLPGSQQFIECEKQSSSSKIGKVPMKDADVKWSQVPSMEATKNVQNAQRTTHLTQVLLLATLHEVVTDESVEQRNFIVHKNMETLRNAIHRNDVTVIQQTVVTTVETITVWLQTIEYRIYMQRQQTGDGPSKERLEEFNNVKQEITNIEHTINQLQLALSNSNDIYNEEDRNKMINYVESLQNQLKSIQEVTKQNEKIVVEDLARWEEFINGIENITLLVNQVKHQFNSLIESDASPQSKLNELENLESENRCHMLKTVHLMATARGLMRDFPNREIPMEVYTIHDITKQIEHHISIQREKALHLLALADEYVQTLKEFEQIVEIADALVESPISLRNLEHLEEEVQNHRKFFINLSHCRAILESLEENLDAETRDLHSQLHQTLYDKANVILDKASGRLQQMSLAASKWTVLEQGMKEETRWLEVAKGRVPDLSNVTSADYDQYINLYQSLSSDIAHHYAKLSHLNKNARKLQELVLCSELEVTYTQPLDIIIELQEDVNNKLRRLIAFRESWTMYNLFTDKLEYWLKIAEQELEKLQTVPNSLIPAQGYMRQFWVSSFVRILSFFYIML